MHNGARSASTAPLFSVVVKEVIENALSHAGPETTVDVAVQMTESTIEVTVSDDGPGIPVSELGPVRAGEETPLDHTSGLGLWLVQWGVQSLGGSVSIDSDGSGTTVRLRVPTDVGPRGTDPVGFGTEVASESVTTFGAVGTET